MSINIKQTLTDNINSEKALSLASGLFPGVIQTAIEYYLNGVTIPLGKDASLTVKKTGANFKLEMTPVEFTGAVTKDSAILKISGTGDNSDAFIEVTFTKKSDSDVSIDLKATMGKTLKWKLSELWPELLDKEPFNEVYFTKGQLELNISKDKKIEFSGSGAIDYKDSQLGAGAIRIIYDGKTSDKPDSSKVSVLVGVVVDSWSPGSIWKPLEDITFKQSGLLFSSLPSTDSETLGDLNLISNSKVPSIVDGKFKIKEGITFFTTLELDNFLKPLENFLGKNQTLSLYANSNLSKKLTLIAKYTANNFKPNNPNAIFEFNNFKLEWDLDIGTSYELTASATGTFYPPDGSEGGIDLTLGSTIKPTAGDISIFLSMQNWVHPFGYQHLTVNDVTASIVFGASADGVTLMLSGDFGFKTDDGNSFEFGVAGEIADFEVPTGIAFLLKDTSPGKMLTLGDFINGVTSIDVSHIPAINEINKILQLKNLDFAVVLGSELKIGDKKFPQGFTADADFDILEQEEVILSLVITKKGESAEFSGLANLKQAIQFGDVFTLSAYDPKTDKPNLNAGPEIAVSSKGMKVDGVNNGDPVYFYVDGYIKVLDIIKAQLYGLITTDGLFEFKESVQVGTKFGNSGTWAGDEILVGLNPDEYSCEAAFDFNFGWKNVSIGPLSIFEVDLIPKVDLPNFDVSAGIGVFVDGKALTFKITGELNFDFLGLHLHFGTTEKPKTLFSIDLNDAPKTLSDVKGEILDCVLKEIEDLLEDALNDLDAFVKWAKRQFELLGKDAVKVAKAILNAFGTAIKDIAQALKDIGYAASEVYEALVKGLGVLASEAEKLVDDIYEKAKECAVKTASLL